MTRSVRAVLIAGAVCLQIQMTSIAQPAQPRASGLKLVVILAVDQMRGDYIDRYRRQWTAGLKRLVSEGAWFRQADYPYFNTITCAGHASISTGTMPSVHGMVLNNWWDRAAGRLTYCTDDPAERPVSYGGPPVKAPGQSAARMLAPAFADELRIQRPLAPRVVSVSLKARSAITLAGHRPDVVTWMDDGGSWVTSTAFAKEPVPFIAEYVRAHPLSADVGRVWDRALPKERYAYDDTALGRPPKIGTPRFPHVVKGDGNGVNDAFAAAWESSPYSDEYVAGLASASIDALGLGQREGTDLLTISFSALDKVGHDFGPESHEVQDILIRLDGRIGALLTKLDREVGRGAYVLALSADHGVAPIPERLAALGFDAGRIRTSRVAAAIEEALGKVLGPGKYVSRVVSTDIYFAPGVYARLLENSAAMDAALGAIRDTPGIARVYRREQLAAAANATDLVLQAAARSYFEGRSGDVVMLPRAYWIITEDAATHGTSHRYDTRVPVILFGHGIRPGEYLEPASPLDIAPTLAYLTSVTMADASGRVLREALLPNGSK
jgi:predicted AlkP superfamily pyrophosphatase or phosphodiesterase